MRLTSTYFPPSPLSPQVDHRIRNHPKTPGYEKPQNLDGTLTYETLYPKPLLTTVDDIHPALPINGNIPYFP